MQAAEGSHSVQLETHTPPPDNPWDLPKAKLAVQQLAFCVGNDALYPLKALEIGNCPKGLADFIVSNYNTIKAFATIVKMPIPGERRIPNSQFAWSDKQIAVILMEVSKVENTEFLPTNSCLRERGLRWVEQFISGRSNVFSELTGLKRSTFAQRASKRDRRTYHKTWTLPDAIKTTRILSQKLETSGYMPTQKQFRANGLNWLSSLISQKFGGIERFAFHCGLKLRRMSQGRHLRKPRHLLKRAARTSKGLKMLWSQLSIPGKDVSPAQRALFELAQLPARNVKRARYNALTLMERPTKRMKPEPRW